MKRRGFEQSDHIRLNLQLLVRREQSPTSFFYRIFSDAPVLPLSISMIIGIIIASHLAMSKLWIGLSIGVLLAFGLLTAGLFNISSGRRLFLTSLSAVALFCCIGAGRFAAIQYCPPRHISHALQEDQQLATLRGRVISPVRSNGHNSGFSTIPWLGSQSSFYLAAEAIDTPSGWKDICGTVRVQVNEQLETIQPGNEIQLYCRLSHFSPPANPGQFNLQKHMNSRGVFVAASVPISEGIEVLRDGHHPLHRLRSWLYRYSANALLDETASDPDVAALESALLLGRRGNLDPAIVAAFQKTNLSHFISLSGMHVGILAGSLWILLRTAQIPKRPRALLCILLLLAYALIVPPRAPTLRAVFISCFFFASALLYRRVNSLNTLALSALVLLFIRPYELFTAGWQLSFLSVLGILLFYKTVHYWILNRVFFPSVLRLNNRFAWFQHVFYRAFELLAVGISIWIFISPILLYYFGQINPLSPLWTVLVFPVILLILYAGFFKIALSSLLPTLASLLGALLNLLAHILEKIVIAFAKVDFLKIASHRPGPDYIVVIYLLLAAIFLIPYYFRRSRQILLSILVLCFLFPWLSRGIDLKNNNTLEMTCLSVGHGQAIVVSTPTGKHLLFDAGSITHQDIARKTIAPYLQHRRMFVLDAVTISHGDLDHLNAIPDIAAAVPIHTIYGNATFLKNTQQPSLEQSLSDRLIQLGYKLHPIEDCQYDNVKIKSLWPCESNESAVISENDRSEIILIEYAERNILLCGDIETYAQNKLLELYPDLKTDILLLPHHGSTTNLNPHFVEHLSPSIVIASCAKRNIANTYKPPTYSLMQCFYTSTDGAVTVKIKADGTLCATGYLNE